MHRNANDALVKRVRFIFADKRENDLNRIVAEFNATYPDALIKLKTAYPDLNEMELNTCVLSYFSFHMKEAATIMGLCNNTVAKYRSSIKKKTHTNNLESLLIPFLH